MMLGNSPTRVSNTTLEYHLWLLGFLTQKQGSVSKLYQCTETQCCLLIASLPAFSVLWRGRISLQSTSTRQNCEVHPTLWCSQFIWQRGMKVSISLFFSWNCPQAIRRTKKQKCECVFTKTKRQQKPKPLNTRKGFQKRLSRGGFGRQRERTPETRDPTAISTGSQKIPGYVEMPAGLEHGPGISPAQTSHK